MTCQLCACAVGEVLNTIIIRNYKIKISGIIFMLCLYLGKSLLYITVGEMAVSVFSCCVTLLHTKKNNVSMVMCMLAVLHIFVVCVLLEEVLQPCSSFLL